MTEYNRIVIGSFKEFLSVSGYEQPVRGSAGIKGTKFHASQQSTGASVLLQHATGTSCQITAEEVPDLVRAHLYHSSAYNPEHIASGEGPTREVMPYHRYAWQSSPLPRYQVHYMKGQTTHVYSNRSFPQFTYS